MRSLAPDVTRLALAALMATDGGRAFGAPSPAIPPPTAAAIGLRGVASAVVADLQLAVTVNGRPTGLIAAFMRAPDGALSASRGDLAEIGLRAPGSGPPDALVPLASLAGVTWTYDASTQTIRFEAPLAALAPRVYDARGGRRDAPTPTSGVGVALNYDVFASGLRGSATSDALSSDYSATLSGRFFSGLGALTQSEIVGVTPNSPKPTATRLDTTWTTVDGLRGMSYVAGDTISGGLSWTRPIRLGGLQVAHGYATRPDLVTSPQAYVGGTAAVPTTVDVYVGGFKAYSQQVQPGPFVIDNLPTLGADGTASVVLRGANGSVTKQDLPFYNDGRLLRRGLYSFSAEVGFPRFGYGSQSFDYGRKPVGVASARVGAADWLTVEGHAEGGAGLLNGGAGLVARTFDRAAVSFALAGSKSPSGTGAQIYAGFDTAVFGVSLDLSTQRTLGTYDDLASVTAAENAQTTTPYSNLDGVFNYGASLDVRPPRELDRISVGAPLPARLGAIGASFVHERFPDGRKSDLATASLTKGDLPYRASVYLTAFHDFSNPRTSGLVAGMTVPLGMKTTLSASFDAQPGSSFGTLSAERSLGPEIGDWGWRATDQEGAAPYREARASYRARYARLDATAAQQPGGQSATVEAAGSIVAMPQGIFLGEPIDDSFAVVDAGAPGVRILRDNDPVGTTDWSGKLLVPGLRSYEDNRLDIDPKSLPVAADAARTTVQVVPARLSGVPVAFGVRTKTDAANVIFVDAAGKFPQAGVTGTVSATGARFVVGYDGRSYIEGLRPHDAVTITLDGAGRTCAAAFDYAPRADGLAPTIGPVVCK